MRHANVSPAVDLPHAHDELNEIRLPYRQGNELHRPSLDTAARAEQQLDHLVEMLATERSLEQLPLQTPKAARRAAAVSEPTQPEPLELSIVMPCLNQAHTVGSCVLKAIYALQKMGVSGEVIVADSGSRDDSVELAESLGARVVHVEQPGYGAALMCGIEAARGRFILMADANDSYDFTQAHRFYDKLCDGAELVQGCRLPSGGGRILPGAMGWLHQYGNPALTWLARRMFKVTVHDVHCGMRGITKQLYQRLGQRCTGIEFASEMVIKSTLFGAKIEEVPIVLYPDGCQTQQRQLQTLLGGCRTLRFFMMLSPRWTFLAPGLALGGAGLLGILLGLCRVSLAGVMFDGPALLMSLVALLVAAQLGCFALLAKSFASSQGMLPVDNRVEAFIRHFSLERTLWLSGALVVSGTAAMAWQAFGQANAGAEQLNYSEAMRWTIPAVGAIALGYQFASSRFLLSILRLAGGTNKKI